MRMRFAVVIVHDDKTVFQSIVVDHLSETSEISRRSIIEMISVEDGDIATHLWVRTLELNKGDRGVALREVEPAGELLLEEAVTQIDDTVRTKVERIHFEVGVGEEEVEGGVTSVETCLANGFDVGEVGHLLIGLPLDGDLGRVPFVLTSRFDHGFQVDDGSAVGLSDFRVRSSIEEASHQNR